MPALLPLLSASAIGVAVAIGGYTFIYARGASYLTNGPKDHQERSATTLLTVSPEFILAQPASA